jgi:hypothetical protein
MAGLVPAISIQLAMLRHGLVQRAHRLRFVAGRATPIDDQRSEGHPRIYRDVAIQIVWKQRALVPSRRGRLGPIGLVNECFGPSQ